VVRGEPAHGKRPHAGRAGVHQRAGCLAHDHARRGLHVQARRRSRLHRMRQARGFRRAGGRPAGDRRRAPEGRGRLGTVQGGRVFQAPAAP
jgi:hypothetical protein